ncbi:MAG: hypothetical protein AAGA05_05330, partial [Pseudomonadota bacterium]
MSGAFRFHAISSLGDKVPDGIHLLWSPPYPTGHAIEGYRIQRRDSQREAEEVCFTLSPFELDRARRQGFLRITEGDLWIGPHDPQTPDNPPWVLRVEINDPAPVVTITSPNGIAAFAATGGKVSDAQLFSSGTCRLRGHDIATLWIVVADLANAVTICRDVVFETGWED